jgi:regulatory protein
MSEKLTPEQALQKIRHYCAWQERCHAEVKEKLYNYGLRKPEVETIIASLIQDNYLNEERFAVQYAGGKFRMKKWGRNKIKYALQQKQVSDYCIKKALKEIDEDQYEETLRELLKEKYDSLKKEQYLLRRKKTTDFLIQKGYEHNLVQRIMQEVVNGQL